MSALFLTLEDIMMFHPLRVAGYQTPYPAPFSRHHSLVEEALGNSFD
jgi:hypothetical protein